MFTLRRRGRTGRVAFALPFAAALLVFLSSPASAKDVYLAIGGSVNEFRTDARIINPSFDKDITITARYLPTGNQNNSGVTSKSITVEKRSMAVYDDVVQSLFGGGTPLGAVRLTSDDDFVASQRIYAAVTCNTGPCTLGQFVPGLEVSAARTRGVLGQLKANNRFRTNVGAVNPNATPARVTWTLYDRGNAHVASGGEITMPPFAVIGPTSILSGFFFSPGTADLSDAWISFASDTPIFAYASMIDSTSTDPTFIPAASDSGVPPESDTPSAKTISIEASNWTFQVTKPEVLRPNDQVTFHISASEGEHGFHLFTPNGESLIEIALVPQNPVTRIVVLSQQGTYVYFCTRSTCGEGHDQMNGSFTVGSDGGPGGPPDY